MIRSRVLIYNHQDPVGPQGYRLTAEQIHTPEAFFHVAEESQPGRPARALSRPVVMGENPSNHVFVDCKVEGQGDLFSDSRNYFQVDHVNALLRRYRFTQRLSHTCFDLMEPYALEFYWDSHGCSKSERWELSAVGEILSVAERGLIRRFRLCQNCSNWLFANTTHQVHCTEQCRQSFFARNPIFKEKRRIYMARRRMEDRLKSARERRMYGK